MVGKYWSWYNCSASGRAHLSTAASTVWICACKSTNGGLQKAAACSCSRPGGYGELAATPLVKKCQSNSYLTSFWPEGIFKNLFKMLPAKYFNWTIEKVCPPTLSSGPECPVHYGVGQYWHRCLNIKLCCTIFRKTLTREAFSLPEICSITLTFKNPLKHYCEQLYKWV